MLKPSFFQKSHFKSYLKWSALFSASFVLSGGVLARTHVVSHDKIVEAVEPSDDDTSVSGQYNNVEQTESIFVSRPIEVDSANIQILDKISGKKYHTNLFLNQPKQFGSIEIELKRCFKNAPEDANEVYAYIQITENGRVIFSKWLFASSVSVNIFSHPVYDVRVEF